MCERYAVAFFLLCTFCMLVFFVYWDLQKRKIWLTWNIRYRKVAFDLKHDRKAKKGWQVFLMLLIVFPLLVFTHKRTGALSRPFSDSSLDMLVNIFASSTLQCKRWLTRWTSVWQCHHKCFTLYLSRSIKVNTCNMILVLKPLSLPGSKRCHSRTVLGMWDLQPRDHHHSVFCTKWND